MSDEGYRCQVEQRCSIGARLFGHCSCYNFIMRDKTDYSLDSGYTGDFLTDIKTPSNNRIWSSSDDNVLATNADSVFCVATYLGYNPEELKSRGIKHWFYPIIETPQISIENVLQVCSMIYYHYEDYGDILVHCSAGVNRSPFIVNCLDYMFYGNKQGVEGWIHNGIRPTIFLTLDKQKEYENIFSAACVYYGYF